MFSLGLDDEVAGEEEEEEEEEDIECQSSNNSLLNLNEVTHTFNFFYVYPWNTPVFHFSVFSTTVKISVMQVLPYIDVGV